MAAQVGSIQLLNGIQTASKPQTKGLLFVEMIIREKTTNAMADTGASHNFISIEEARWLGLQTIGGEGSIKAVNSTARPIHGVAR